MGLIADDATATFVYVLTKNWIPMTSGNFVAGAFIIAGNVEFCRIIFSLIVLFKLIFFHAAPFGTLFIAVVKFGGNLFDWLPAHQCRRLVCGCGRICVPWHYACVPQFRQWVVPLPLPARYAVWWAFSEQPRFCFPACTVRAREFWRHLDRSSESCVCVNSY